MNKLELYARIEGGKLIIPNRVRFDQEIASFPDQQVTITVKKAGKRSTPQNNYYHGVVVESVRHRMIELGHKLDHDETHEWLKKEFNYQELANESGELIGRFALSTTDLNKEEFAVYLDKIMEWAASILNIYIPPASSQNTIEF